MEATVEKRKKKRSIVRTAVTKLINNIENSFSENPVDYDTIEESINQLKIKAESLKTLDSEIEIHIKSEEYEAEVLSSEEYQDKISLTIFKANKKLNNTTTVSENVQTVVRHNSNNEKTLVKLPKLNIPKFFGDCSQYMNFWNSFKVSIHENQGLSKVEKFNYLKSYLGGRAASSVEGFSISEDNYDSALKILESRFGNKDIIINSHMNKLLNIPPVYRSSDISKLKTIHATIETNVRSLTALGIQPETYSNMLIAVILKNLPSDLTLEYNRKYVKDPNQMNINVLLEFIQYEIQSHERTYSFSTMKTEARGYESKTSKYSNERKKDISSSTHEFIATVSEKENKKCLFCQKLDHKSEKCNSISVDEKINILRKQARCDLCLGWRHKKQFCKTLIRCKICGGKHNSVICFKSNQDLRDKSNLDEKQTKIISAISHDKTDRILLQTCCVEVGSKQNRLNTRIILDTGSSKSFLLKQVADKLKLNKIRQEKLSVFTFGGETPIEKTFDVVKITLYSRHNSDSKLELEVLVTDTISSTEISPPSRKEIMKNQIPENLILADSPDSRSPIGILIGADSYYDVVNGNIKHLSKNLVAIDTIFGYCLQGKTSNNHVSLTLNVVVEDLISEQIQQFWDLESSGLVNDKQNSSECEVMKSFESNIKYENHRYNVRLPWKNDIPPLDNNRKIAERRFFYLRRKFKRNRELFLKYREVLQDYLKQGIIELVPDMEDDENLVTFYLPHREVIREDRTTSLRIVYDASSHMPNSASLNDCLHVGPNLYPDIFDILLRFRLNPVAYTADMKQAFLQIMIDERDRDVTRFLFTEDPNNESLPPLVYRFTRVLFGINSSPFLLAGTIKYHLKKYCEIYPDTVNFLNENVYVDDIIGSHSTVDEALTSTLESINIFEDASLRLHKWRTNSKALHELWEKNGIIAEKGPEVIGVENIPYKVLGIAWDNVRDILYFDVESLLSFLTKKTDTKRFVLQAISRVFDPTGFLGPFTVRMKCLMQKIWSLGVEWDEILPEDIRLSWRKWCEEVPHIDILAIPRYYFFDCTSDMPENLQLHCFSDASMHAYGTVVYLRTITHDQNIRTVFVASKNRVAPLKSLTLPKLELMGALLSAKLCKSVLGALKLKIPCYFWTDSKIVYFWVRGSPEKFKPFVKNRVEEIRNLTSGSDWHHCPGVENPADLVSRGTKISKIINDPIWLKGPEWLQRPPECWPKSENKEQIDSEELEYRKKPNIILQCLIKEQENPIDITKFSRLEKLIRVTAWVKKIIAKFKKKTNICHVLTTEELLDAENYLIKFEQKKFFTEEYESLKGGKSVEKDSALFNFVPFIDETEIMRLGGRLEFGDLSTEEKHPIILPKRSWLTNLIVQREHEKTMHGGTACTLASIRQRFWIPKGRQMVKSVIKKCVICLKYLSKPSNQVTAPLPEDRINSTPPFSVCGLDFAGPIYVRNFKETQKSYIVLFTCGVTRSIHLELVSDMSTNSFLLALRRFLARRGNCKVIYSDNAKSFKKAKKEIENLSNIISDELLSNFLTKKRIVWKNIVERAAWWGGFYERLVKSVKDCLRKIVGKALLSFEEMSTLLVEVEAVLNMRPLTYVYNENDEPLPLTPMNFLNFGREPTFPINFAEIIGNESKRSALLKRKNYQSLLLKQIWAKWKQQYLLDLRTAHSLKNANWQAELKIGDVVLIEEDTKNKLLWKLGRIEKTILGRDNKVRSYEVKTPTGLLRRTIQHLYPLEL